MSLNLVLLHRKQYPSLEGVDHPTLATVDQVKKG